MIEVRDIHKSFDQLNVLRGISFSVSSGEIVAIVGPSGAGKTTLLQIMGTVEKANAGAVLYDGVEVTNLSSDQLATFRNQNIGFVFQFHQLLPEFTALENVMMPALIGGKSADEAEERAEEVLRFLKLGDRLQHRPNELSGGEKQRVAVARALINRPKVIFADEPSGSLDSENKKELHKLFFQLRDEFGLTFVVVTHDDTLASISDRVIRICDGKVD